RARPAALVETVIKIEACDAIAEHVPQAVADARSARGVIGRPRARVSDRCRPAIGRDGALSHMPHPSGLRRQLSRGSVTSPVRRDAAPWRTVAGESTPRRRRHLGTASLARNPHAPMITDHVTKKPCDLRFCLAIYRQPRHGHSDHGDVPNHPRRPLIGRERPAYGPAEHAPPRGWGPVCESRLDRKSTRLELQSRENLVCRLLL